MRVQGRTRIIDQQAKISWGQGQGLVIEWGRMCIISGIGVEIGDVVQSLHQKARMFHICPR